jgi:DNA-binding MarR family transcriptional regulator
MDKKITDVLQILDKEDSPSQRQIAEETGFSLGLVNILIKKAVKKGFIKIEKLNSRNIKYILTPAGIKEKTDKTIDYIKRSYIAIKRLEAEIKELAYRDVGDEKDIYLLKSEDEIYALVSSILDELKVDYFSVDTLAELEAVENESVLYHWHPELEVEQQCIDGINIFRV